MECYNFFDFCPWQRPRREVASTSEMIYDRTSSTFGQQDKKRQIRPGTDVYHGNGLSVEVGTPNDGQAQLNPTLLQLLQPVALVSGSANALPAVWAFPPHGMREFRFCLNELAGSLVASKGEGRTEVLRARKHDRSKRVTICPKVIFRKVKNAERARASFS